ncbi:HCL621Wp [Eremothecium sinecaudum]|uniref:HCL621Wp n=1 Tax=Eremothecium sinecaudum TaxID=45286 RepID=A0A120K1L8_9SACH|nr:HCL621Wp [Eremothecium sinecaudum]AMD19530.1 HCL621Wp [Eremothecium sinecaudum]
MLTHLLYKRYLVSSLRYNGFPQLPKIGYPKPRMSRGLYHAQFTLQRRWKSSTPISKVSQAANISPKSELKLSPSESTASSMDDIKRLLELARPESKSLIYALILIIISGAVSMTIPSVVGKLLDNAKKDEDDPEKDGLIFGLTENQFYGALGGVFVIGAVANMGRIIILKVVGEQMVARLRTRTMKAALQQDASFLDVNRVGDLISRLSTDANIVSKAITHNTSDGARAIIQGLVGFGMMSYISWQLTAVMALLGPPLVIMAMIYGRKIRTLSRELQTRVGGLTKVAEEQLSAMKTIQAYGGERKEINRYANEVRSVFRVGFREATTSGVFFGTTMFVGNTALLSLLFVGSSMIKSGFLTVGELSSFMMYAAYTGNSLFGLSTFYSELMKGAGAAARVFELNDRVPLIHPTRGKGPDSLENKVISFKNVDFSYPTRSTHNVFKNLNLTINPGEHVCIVGPSGGGKSTVATLLMRYYDVDTGSITIGGEDIRKFNLRKYRRKLGIVQQEPMLFNGSILDNITYTLPKEIASDQQRLAKAMADANCSKFIVQFPDGLNTMVGPRGAQLSGGQKQRVALARAFLLDPSVLILDEATSALDSQSEQVVAQTLTARAQRNQITISIAHRVSTIQYSSRVIVLSKHGHVAETGTYASLVKDPNSELNKLLSQQDGLVEEEQTTSEQEHTKDMIASS